MATAIAVAAHSSTAVAAVTILAKPVGIAFARGGIVRRHAVAVLAALDRGAWISIGLAAWS